MKEINVTRIINIILVILMFALCVLGFLLVRQFSYLKRQENVKSYKALVDTVRKERTLTSQDVYMVKTWMTFDYINKIFNIPESYLRETLRIQDQRYPRITLGKYAKSQGIDPILFLGYVEALMRTYLNNT